jgi:hypothetical protein
MYRNSTTYRHKLQEQLKRYIKSRQQIDSNKTLNEPYKINMVGKSISSTEANP